jgi:hypothetical protein
VEHQVVLGVESRLEKQWEEEWPMNAETQLAAFPGGVILYSRTTFSLFRMRPHVPVSSGSIGAWARAGDAISQVEMPVVETLCVGSFMCRFRVYTFEWSDGGAEVVGVVDLDGAAGFLSLPFSYSASHGVLFAGGRKSVSCLFDGKCAYLTTRGSMPCVVADGECPRLVQGVSGGLIRTTTVDDLSGGDLSDPFALAVSPFSVKSCVSVGTSLGGDLRRSLTQSILQRASAPQVTALASTMQVRQGKLRSVLLVGSSTGSLSSVSESSFTVIECLSSPIANIIVLPMRPLGLDHCLVIGADSTTALVKGTKVVGVLLTSGFPVVAVSCSRSQELLALETSDGRFEVFNLVDSRSISERSERPVEFELVWQRTAIDMTERKSSLRFSRVGTSSFFFNVFHVGESSPSGDAQRMLALMRSPASSDLSIVLCGAVQGLTFFYPPFQVADVILFGCAPPHAAQHYLACRLLAAQGGRSFAPWKCEDDKATPFSNFLPSVISLIDSPNPVIAEAAVRACGSCMSFLSSFDCELLLCTLDFKKGKLKEAEQFLLAILTITRPDLVPEDRHSESVASLLTLARSGRSAASLAMILLIAGRRQWVRADRTILIQIFHLWLTQTFPEDIRLRLLDFGQKDSAGFLDAVHGVAQQIASTPELARKLCEMVSAVSLCEANGIGAHGSLALAEIAVDFPVLADIANATLDEHGRQFKNVARSGLLTVIGLPSGVVHVFKKHKRVGEARLFEGPVDMVSIAPGEKYAGAFSRDLQTLSWFLVPSTGFFRKKAIVPHTAVVPAPDINGQIKWRDETCFFEEAT